jgi:hypothetical protein
METRVTPSLPIPNAYWVQPGRFMAGEYPGDEAPDVARTRLNLFLDAGVRSFVDLTEKGESGLEPYAGLLQEVAAPRGLLVEHRRLPIRDVDVPRSQSEMIGILDAIDAALTRRHTVYLHCWGGSGRTGTVVGCHLVRHGSTGEGALQQVADSWSTVEKSWRSRHSPQTNAQREWVRAWSER